MGYQHESDYCAFTPAPVMPTHGYQGNCSIEVIEVSVMLYSKISSNMANYSAWESLTGSCYVYRIKRMCVGTFGTSHVCASIPVFWHYNTDFTKYCT